MAVDPQVLAWSFLAYLVLPVVIYLVWLLWTSLRKKGGDALDESEA